MISIHEFVTRPHNASGDFLYERGASEDSSSFIARVVAGPYDGKILRYKIASSHGGGWWTVRTFRIENEPDQMLCDRHDAHVAAVQAYYPPSANQDGTPSAFLSAPVGL